MEFCSQLCLRTSLGPRLRRDRGHVASPPRSRTALPRAAGAPARAGGERTPRHSFAGRPRQGSEPPGTSRPLRGSAELRRLGGRSPTRFPPGLQAPPAPRQAEREPGCSLPDAAPERGPTPSLPEPAGCATLLAARENPFLASASSSCILEHVSECITTRSLIEIQLGDLAPQPSALTWAMAPRPAVRARGHAGPEQGRGQKQHWPAQGQHHARSLHSRGLPALSFPPAEQSLHRPWWQGFPLRTQRCPEVSWHCRARGLLH